MRKRSPDKISPDAAAALLANAERVRAAGRRLSAATLAAAETKPSLFDPRELRLVLDAASVGHAALVALLVEKGLISGAEYLESLAESLETEAAEAETESTNDEGTNENA